MVIVAESCVAAEPLFSAWLDDALEAGERAALEGHLGRCPTCWAELDALASTRALLRSLPVRRAPVGQYRPPVRGAVSSRWHGAPWTASLRPMQRSGRLAPAGLAAALLAGLLSAAAFSVGDRPAPGSRLVSVPVEVYAAEHLVRTVYDPLFAPVLVRSTP
jgi:anti-sigma factor RsiW